MNVEKVKIGQIGASAVNEDGKLKQPAVTFEYNRAVAADGTVAYNGDIYEHFIHITDKCMDTSVKALMNGVSPAFISRSIDLNSSNTLRAIDDSCNNAIINHYYNFVTMFNFMMDSLVGDKLDKCEYRLKYDSFIIYQVRNIRKIDKFFDLSMESRDQVIKSGAFDAYCISKINEIGESVYMNSYVYFAKALAILKAEDEKSLQALVTKFNAIFATFMGNITYECGVFVSNIATFHPMIFSHDTTQKIRSKDPEIGSSKFRDDDYEDPFYVDEM